MRVKNLQQLNVSGQHGDQVALVAALQLGGGQLAQHAKDLVPDERQQLECNKMVAALLRVVQHAAGHGQNRQQNAGGLSTTGTENARLSSSAYTPRTGMKMAQRKPATPSRTAQTMTGARGVPAYKAAHYVEIAAGTFVFHHCASFP